MLNMCETIRDNRIRFAQLAGPLGGGRFGVVAALQANVERREAVVAPDGGVGRPGHDELASLVAEIVKDGVDVKGMAAGGGADFDVVANPPVSAAGEGLADENVGLGVERLL